MLRKHIKAFGFDGQLSNLPAKVHIWTVDGQVPILVPMYHASPQKWEVIDEQLNTWFEQGIIEPSKSPWSMPVVITYRNGKPRFCVDYWKLNAATIPDEFPIPRQSNILASLSGAQVLSSLDALSRFTQLELVEEDIERLHLELIGGYSNSSAYLSVCRMGLLSFNGLCRAYWHRIYGYFVWSILTTSLYIQSHMKNIYRIWIKS